MTDDHPVKAQGLPARMQGEAPQPAAMPALAIPSRSHSVVPAQGLVGLGCESDPGADLAGK